MANLRYSLIPQMIKLSFGLLLLLLPLTFNGQSLTTYSYDNMNRLITIISPDGNQITFSYDAVGNRISRQTTYIRPIIRELQNMIIEGGQFNCFEATQTLRLAGNGTIFKVQNGGSVNLIAGQNISFMPGVNVYHGGYLHGHITTNGQYCIPFKNQTAYYDEKERPDSNGSVSNVGKAFFTVYPNPTTDKFTLLLNNPYGSISMQLIIYGVMGEQIFNKEILITDKYEFSLTNQRPGMYIVHVTQAEMTGCVKVIKN